MKRIRPSLTPDLIFNCLFAILTVAATTALMVLIGREVLGEAVIALLFLIPVGWSATRWGQAPGICAAVAAALAFDFFFIPPFHTLTVGNLEGWLVLVIFLDRGDHCRGAHSIRHRQSPGKRARCALHVRVKHGLGRHAHTGGGHTGFSPASPGVIPGCAC